MRLAEKVSIIAILLALAMLAFPISVAQAQSEPMVFRLGEGVPPTVDISKPLKPKHKNFNPCNCWSYVKAVRGTDMPNGFGMAKNYPVNMSEPFIGAIVVTYESGYGHLGIVIDVSRDIITIEDYNYERCAHTVRPLPIDSPLIKGYIL